MKNLICIFCNDQITSTNNSSEHILPESIGGKLKSKILICHTCNINFGKELDDALYKQFKIIDMSLNLNKKRKIITKTNASYKGKQLIFTGEGPKFGPEVIENGDKKHYIYYSEESLRNYLMKYSSRLEKIGKSIDIEEKIKNAVRIKKKISEPFLIKVEGEEEKLWRACGKIVYEFLFLTHRDIRLSNAIFREFVLGKIDQENFPICFGDLNYSPIKRDTDKLYHTIIIEGRRDDELLIGYLEIYGAFKTVMIIDKKYKGIDFINGYCHDLMDNKYNYISPIPKIPISSKNLKNLISECSTDNLKFVIQQRLYIAGIKIGASKARLYSLKKIIFKLGELINYNDNDLTEEMLHEILDYLYEAFLKKGLNVSYLQLVKEENMAAELTQKIILLLDFLRKQFRNSSLNPLSLTNLIEFFMHKGAKFKDQIN